MLVLSAADVRELLDPDGCREAVRDCLAAVSRGEVVLPLRMMVHPTDRQSVLALMPVHRAGPSPRYALKSVAVFPGNAAHGIDPHQGSVTLFDGLTGRPVAVLNAEPITAIRTAAATAVATDVLARADARVLAIVGSGHQARAHLDAVTRGRPFAEVRVASRTPAHAEALARVTGAAAYRSVEEAVRGADVVVTVTSAREPVIDRSWLAPGAHVNGVGSCFPDVRELDTATMVDGTLFTDRVESFRHEPGDFRIPVAEGALAEDHPVVELGSVIVGDHPGRTAHDELTVFKSLGIAAEDLAAGEYVVARARETGAGTVVDF